MNKLLNSMKNSQLSTTTNGALAYDSTGSKVLDLFALGGAFRNHNDPDCILLFKNAFEEDALYALKCLFYLRDIRGGQGERRFFRVCMKWMANEYPDIVCANLDLFPEYGRWDDLYCLVGTSVEKQMWNLIRKQLALDVECKTPSLLAKWLKSENTSSAESNRLGNKTRSALNMNHRQYRKTLSYLRNKINIVERLMSANRWDEIEFDKIPSRAGLIYKNAFARRDIIKAKYEAFAKSDKTTVNAKDLYPYEVVAKAYNYTRNHYWNSYSTNLNDVDRLMINKYWDNLKDYFDGCSLNALAMVDTSGSMTGSEASAPINVAISLGLYCAERAKGPFANHYISFSSRPQLIETNGVDFCDKVERIYRTNLCENTNLKAGFDMILNTALKNHLTQSDMPETIIVISDMQIDGGNSGYGWGCTKMPDMEAIRAQWARAGYKMPKLIYWDVNAYDKANILDKGPMVSYVSGFSPSIFKAIMSGKTQKDLMYEVLNSERYSAIHL